MRYIAIFLLIANLAYVFWSVTRPPAAAGPAGEEGSGDRPLLNTGITLVSEFAAQAAEQAELNAEADARCTRITGFASIDAANSLLIDVQQTGYSGGLALTGEPLPSQYRVYLPPASSQSIATITLDGLSERLSAADLQIDSYLITRGTLSNGIALGVFNDESNALRVQSEVAALGYEPRIEEIPRSTGEIGVWLLNPQSAPLNEAEWLDLSAERPGLIRSENLCQTLVQASQFP